MSSKLNFSLSKPISIFPGERHTPGKNSLEQVEKLVKDLKEQGWVIKQLSQEVDGQSKALAELNGKLYPKKLEISFYCKTNRVDYS